MTNSETSDRNAEERRAFIKQWAEYVETHDDDEEWSRQQKKIVDSQLQSATELAEQGDTDPAEFYRKKDEIAPKRGGQVRVRSPRRRVVVERSVENRIKVGEN